MPYLGIHAVSDKILIVGHQISRILVRGLQPCQNLLGNLFVIPVVSLISNDDQNWVEMSSYSLNNMSKYHAFNYTSNSRNKNRSRCIRKNILEDNETENFGKPMTVVLPAENVDQLQYESETNHVNLNTRINQIIKDHLDWHSAAHDAKMYYIPKPLITKAIDHLTEQELSEFAQSMINDLQDMSLLLRGEFNFSSFWDIINMWLRITRTPNRFEQSEYEHKIVIRHDMGYKYSYLIKEVFRIVIHRFNKPFHYKITENTILIKSAS
jgi:hypothetical protein